MDVRLPSFPQVPLEAPKGRGVAATYRIKSLTNKYDGHMRSFPKKEDLTVQTHRQTNIVLLFKMIIFLKMINTKTKLS